MNRRPSIHSADTQVQTGPACEWSGATGRDSVVSSPLRDVHVNRGVLAVRARNGDEQLQARLALVAEPRAVSCFMAEWIESVLSGFESQLSEVRAHDLPPHLGRTEPAVILGASAIWQGGEGPGHEALLGRAAGQARGSAFERRHSGNSRESCAKSKNCAKKKN